MKIVSIKLSEIEIPLAKPFKTALRTVNSVNDVIVKVELEDGTVGYGEAPPTAVITGETKGSIKDAIMNYIAPAIVGMDILQTDEIFMKLDKAILHNTSAKAAVDIAIYDALGRFLKQPLYKLLGGFRNEVETDITISVNAIPEMVRDSIEAVESGFNILKVKVGKEGRKDIERISEIRKAVGEAITIRVDANQGWTEKEAIKIISDMEDKGLNIELVEQPVPANDFDGLKNITSKVYTKILADESVFSLRDAMKVISEHAADYINIKLMKTGGIHNALKICDIAQEYGVECMIGCMLESKVSVSAGAHLAAARGIVTMADIDGPSLCSIDPYKGGPDFVGSKITFDDKLSGIGINIDSITFK